MCVKETSKKTKLLLTCLLGCSFLMAQNGQISDFVRIDFPARTVKLSKEELKMIVDKGKLDSSRLDVPVDTKGQYYSIDSILLTLHGERWNAPKDYLTDRQRGFEGLSKVDGINCDWTSQIKNINNYSVLIINIDSRDWGSYFF